ncbi:uncharacterized protein EAE97_002726 [Botrytis byssoidea]|uniref:Heterokaryon incompatibility domain-containing protein n=1 Tax=Botrytis byssoidea TaxID=139641 RepID=A0A9P5IRQ1_9HELO|nr:uncharacterized protein EAE97_002726 [Botrytis byssoidea]KAF7951175.1 hypothetical protein EAE97_002726 [Botrytis byssoidea]
MSETLTTCATCERIIEFSDIGIRQQIAILGTVSSLIDTECPHRRWITKLDPDGPAIQNFSKLKISMSKSASSIVLRPSRKETGSLGRHFEFVREKNDEYPHSRRAHLCDKNHGTACEYPGKLTRMDAIQPTWLIDTVAGCLVPGPGKVTSICYNSQEFYQKDLWQRYLWADTLCIVQDDAETLQTELNSIARVYTTSCITIVAADGIGANHGLRGFKGITPQRDFKQNVMSMTPPIKLIDHRNRIGKTSYVYHSRAWTHQEYLGAKRRLIFENGTVYWECSASTWSEELIPDIKPYKARKIDLLLPQELFVDTTFPDRKNMNSLLREFNQKNLTSPGDALAAFSGIQWGLSQIFEGGLLYGIPELFFEIGLMWNPIGFGERRYSIRKEMSQLPSWSFLGWQVGARLTDDCEFEATSWKRAEYVKGFQKPVTTWYTMDHTKSTNRRQITSTWYKYKILAENIKQVPLEGWMRTRFGWDCGDPAHLSTFAYSGDGQKYAYWHSNSPDRWYKYPIPVLDSKKQHPVQLHTQFLYC